ncbi:nuclear transport factor 2 family protein [Candidatus Mycobacterium wuenschmannii]|uniref:Nuclear transport factor 2 family protein n=1 Tax=Candidatus Mycobacterium wuenschmannii TaxID=3027808 RepID=A0ABY8W3V2_9MYCO|nr:nuclear transport factor 2 family protein [Candidatus Mycobacterium wuenschmannii]WIM89093.1 nuclear transport factor 2 family protein [Candidatus Mycobacterium wuenschmannii]
MTTIDRPLSTNEQLVLDFVHAAYGQAMNVDAMTALLHEDFEWQLNVPLSPVVHGREAAKAALAQQSGMSSGMVDGSEIRSVVSTGDTVVVERVDVNMIGETPVKFFVAAIFEVRDGLISCWREYWDTAHIAKQLGIDPLLMFDQLES